MKNGKRFHKVLVLGGAALLFAAGLAEAGGRHGAMRGAHRSQAIEVGGEVEVVKQVPGGTVRVGVVIGTGGRRVERREPEVVVVERRPAPEVIVVKERRPEPEIVVVEKRRCEPQRTVVVEVERDWRDVEYRRLREREFRSCRNGGRVYESDAQFSYDRNEGGYREHYFRDGHQVSYDVQGPDGRYHYFENGEMISIDDNRYGKNKHIFLRK